MKQTQTGIRNDGNKKTVCSTLFILHQKIYKQSHTKFKFCSKTTANKA